MKQRDARRELDVALGFFGEVNRAVASAVSARPDSGGCASTVPRRRLR